VVELYKVKKVKTKVIITTKKAIHKVRSFFRGFTIVELIIVISIIAVLSSIIGVSAVNYVGKSKDSRLKSEISQISKDVAMYYADHSTYENYTIPSSFVLVAAGSDYVCSISEDGTKAVFYAKLATSSNYWCGDYTGSLAEITAPPDSGVYTCTSGSGDAGCGVGPACSEDYTCYNDTSCVACDTNGFCNPEEDCRCSDCACEPEETCTDDIELYSCTPDSGSGGQCLAEESGFSGGDGSAQNPWQICNCDMLQLVGSNLEGNFILTNDIDCSSIANFDPIGDSVSSFIGNFDGAGHTVSNLTINRPTEDWVGLFGYVGPSGSVEHVGVVNVSIVGKRYTGALAGMSGGTIKRSYSTGLITARDFTGGLVGVLTGLDFTGASIENSYSYVNISTDQLPWATNLGGLVGHVIDATVKNSFATGNVDGLTEGEYFGGLVGRLGLGGGTASTLIDSFSTGSVSGSYAGSLIGLYDGRESIQDCYWNNHVGNPEYCYNSFAGTGDTGCVKIEDNQSYFYSISNPPMSNWDFVNVWQENPGSFPTLK
jgi:prepilin-type N-terminal cleavage/methylation domain-containing protein